MAYRLAVFTLALFTQVAFGALEQTTAKVAPWLNNMVKNPSCKYGVENIADGSGILSRNTTSALDNGTDCAIDATASGQYIDWASVNAATSAAYLSGQNCFAKVTYTGDASLYELRVYSNVSLLNSATLLNSSSGAKTAILNFPCGDLTYTPAIQIYSTSASAAAINVARVFVGEADNTGFTKLPDQYSALVGITGTVTNETGNWLNGNCTWSPTGTLTCPVNSGVYTQIPNCTANNQGSRGVMAYVATSSSVTSLVFGSRNTTTDAVGDDSVVITCQKAGVDFEATRQAISPDLADLSGFAKSAATASCNWTTSSATTTAFTANASCPTMTTSGNLQGPATKIPGFIATNILPGNYVVQVNGVVGGRESSSGTQVCVFELYDGTTSSNLIQTVTQANTGTSYTTFLSGQFTYTSKQTNVAFQIRTKRTSGNALCGVENDTGDLAFTLIPLNQGTPAPLLVDSVTTFGGGTERQVRAAISCATSSSVISSSGSWLTVSNRSSGTCALTVPSGVFSGTPSCVANNLSTSYRDGNIVMSSATAGTLYQWNGSGTAFASDNTWDIICMGPR